MPTAKAGSASRGRLKKKPRARVVTFYDDAAIAGVLDAEAALDRARGNGVRDTDDLAAAVEKAYQQAEDTATRFQVRCIGARAYQDLLAEHPATDDDHAAVRAELGNDKATAPWSIDGFPRALIRASCADPVLSEADIETIAEEWNDAESGALFAACLDVNTRTGVSDELHAELQHRAPPRLCEAWS